MTLTAIGAAVQAHPAHAAAPEEWVALQRDIAASYTPLATPDGRFPDYVEPRNKPWSRPSLGLALVQAGLAQKSNEQVDTGLRALNHFVAHGPRKGPPGVFDHYAVATAYNVLREQRPEHPLFSERRGQWEEWLRRQPLHWLPNSHHYANKYMVEVVAVIESRRSGLASDHGSSAMGAGEQAERMALRVLDEVAPTIARNASTGVAGSPALVLSDPSNDALAYHALTLGFFGRAVDLLGPRASDRARESLQRVARASWALTAPDGDLAYVGRSNQQAWALALTAYGAEVAAADADATWAPRFHAVADRAIARLRAVHGIGPHGLSITPSGIVGGGAGRDGLDGYADGPSYGGLTLTGLNWAIEHAQRHDRQSGEIASDSPSDWQLGKGRTAFHAVRTSGSWFAVKRSRSSSARDLRYDFGLVALKRPTGDGGWYDVVRPRPHTARGADSAGPVLIGRGGRALPDGVRSSVSGRGAVTVRGGYRARNGKWASGAETFRFAPTGCGVRATFTRKAGGVLEYSVFFPSRPKLNGAGVSGSGIAVHASPQPAVKLRAGYSSSVDGRMTRAVMRFRAGRAPVNVTICGA